MDNIFIKAAVVLIIVALLAAICVLWLRTANLTKTIAEQKTADTNISMALNQIVTFLNQQIEQGKLVIPSSTTTPPPEQPAQ